MTLDICCSRPGLVCVYLLFRCTGPEPTSSPASPDILDRAEGIDCVMMGSYGPIKSPHALVSGGVSSKRRSRVSFQGQTTLAMSSAPEHQSQRAKSSGRVSARLPNGGSLGRLLREPLLVLVLGTFVGSRDYQTGLVAPLPQTNTEALFAGGHRRVPPQSRHSPAPLLRI